MRYILIGFLNQAHDFDYHDADKKLSLAQAEQIKNRRDNKSSLQKICTKFLQY